MPSLRDSPIHCVFFLGLKPEVSACRCSATLLSLRLQRLKIQPGDFEGGLVV